MQEGEVSNRFRSVSVDHHVASDASSSPHLNLTQTRYIQRVEPVTHQILPCSEGLTGPTCYGQHPCMKYSKLTAWERHWLTMTSSKHHAKNSDDPPMLAAYSSISSIDTLVAPKCLSKCQVAVQQVHRTPSVANTGMCLYTAYTPKRRGKTKGIPTCHQHLKQMIVKYRTLTMVNTGMCLLFRQYCQKGFKRRIPEFQHAVNNLNNPTQSKHCL